MAKAGVMEQREMVLGAPAMMADAAMAPAPASEADEARLSGKGEAATTAAEEPPAEEAVALREDFSETAFFEPHLLLGPDGSATVEFKVPDSVTEWNVWVHAITTDLRAGSIERQARSVKELMVRPYLPRFLREGDAASGWSSTTPPSPLSAGRSRS
jgi:hypothetical protein